MNYGFGGKTLGWARVAKLENMKAFTPSPVQFYQNPKNGLPNHYGHIMSGSEMSRKAIIKIGFFAELATCKTSSAAAARRGRH